jgi:hypothetical protein
LANVGEFGESARHGSANVGESGESARHGLANVGECIESDPFSKNGRFGEYSNSPNGRIFGEYSNSTNSPASGHCLGNTWFSIDKVSFITLIVYRIQKFSKFDNRYIVT